METVIYRYDDPQGGYWYSFLNPTKGKLHEWEPSGLVPNGATERAYCHKHPNNRGFSTWGLPYSAPVKK